MGLWIVRRGADVRHASEADKFAKITRDTLRPVVGNHARARVGKLLSGALEDGRDVMRRHGFAQFPVHEKPRPAIENRAQIVERARDIDVREIDVPMRVRLRRLVKPRAFFRRRACPPIQAPRRFEDAIHRCRTHRDVACLQHPIRQGAIAVEGVLRLRAQNAIPFGLGKPMVARHGPVGRGHRAVRCRPAGVLGACDPEPLEQPTHGQLGARTQRRHAIDDLVAPIRRHPARGHGPPYFFSCRDILPTLPR